MKFDKDEKDPKVYIDALVFNLYEKLCHEITL